jgi:hypothetical protein
MLMLSFICVIVWSFCFLDGGGLLTRSELHPAVVFKGASRYPAGRVYISVQLLVYSDNLKCYIAYALSFVGGGDHAQYAPLIDPPENINVEHLL